MRRRSDLAALLALTACTAAGTGCDGVQLSLQLRPGVNSNDERVDTGPIASLHVFLTDGAEAKDDFIIEVDKAEQADLPEVTVERSRPFSVDVWGCPEPDACAEQDVQFRGCVLLDLSGQEPGSTVPVPIDMIEKDDPKVVGCPPKVAQ